MQHVYPRMINLERSDYQIVRQMAEERAIDEKRLTYARRRLAALVMQLSPQTTESHREIGR